MTALLLSSPGAAAEPLPTLPPSWVEVVLREADATIHWGAPADGGSGVSHYVVYRGEEHLANTTDLSYVDLDPNGSPYSVAAVGAAGESVAIVGVPTSGPECVAWVEGFPPIKVNVWECLDVHTALGPAFYVADRQPPLPLVMLPPIPT